jgi:hypothetical protein
MGKRLKSIRDALIGAAFFYSSKVVHPGLIVPPSQIISASIGNGEISSPPDHPGTPPPLHPQLKWHLVRMRSAWRGNGTHQG